MTCVECHRPFRWDAPGERGMMQGWYRHYESSPHGFRCADRGSCKRAADELQPSLFDAENPDGPRPEQQDRGPYG